MVNLDRLIAPKQNSGVNCKRLEPIEVLDKMLLSERVKKQPERFGSYIMGGNPSSTCPRCYKYVESEGVVCVSCNAYVHFECAGVTQEEIDSEWDGVDFECDGHNKTAMVRQTTQKESECDVSNQSEAEYIFDNVNVNSYKLNVKGKIKEKLANISSPMVIDENDGGRQYTIKLNSVTYQLIMENFINLGEQLGGVQVKRDHVDQCGLNVQVQYNLKITNVDVSVTCYHTTSSMLIQLMGKKLRKDQQKYNESLR